MIRIGSGLVEMATSWTTLKSIASSKSLSLQYEDDTLNNLYFIFAIDPPVIYTTVIFKGTVPAVSDTTPSRTTRSPRAASMTLACRAASGTSPQRPRRKSSSPRELTTSRRLKRNDR